jgi:hypothetical protein
VESFIGQGIRNINGKPEPRAYCLRYGEAIVQAEISMPR